METKNIKIRKVIAEEGKLIVSKARVINEETNVELPEVYTKELFLGAEANLDDFEEVDEAEINVLVEQHKEALQKLQEERLKLSEQEEISEEAEEGSNDSN